MDERPVVLVTGASQGLGAATASWLGRAGAAVVLVARSAERLAEVAAEVRRLGGEAECRACDVGYAEACYDVVEATLKRFGRLDGLVNNAGTIHPIVPLERSNPEEWGRNLQVNLLAPYYMTRFSLAALRASKGRLVNISSGAAFKPIVGWSAYCTAKAGLLHMTKVVAEEAPEVTAVSLRPGVIDTEMQEQIRRRGHEGMESGRHEYFRRLKQEGGLEPPEVPARAAAWLALHAPREWSGELVEYGEERVAAPARQLLGDTLA